MQEQIAAELAALETETEQLLFVFDTSHPNVLVPSQSINQSSNLHFLS